MPNLIELSTHERVERTEQRVLERQFFDIELPGKCNQPRPLGFCYMASSAHVMVTAFDLCQGRFHAVNDGGLDVVHGRGERLVEFDHVGLAFLEVLIDRLMEAVRPTEISFREF